VASRVLTTVQECEDLVHGLTFLGTGGGGGQPERGIELLARELEAGHQIRLLDIEELPDDAWTLTVAGMGGRPPAEGPDLEELARIGLTEEKYDRFATLEAAVQELAQYAGGEVEAIVPIELGSGNTPGPIVVGLHLGIPTVDGDYAGRAIPEVTNLKPEIYGVPIWPVAFVDRWGNVCLLKKAVSTAMVDRIGRMLCRAAFGGVGIACYLLKAREAKELMVQGSLSRALAIGRARRTALEEGRDPVSAMAQADQGWVLFRGVVQAAEWEDRGEGYMFGYGTNHIQGLGEYEGQSFRIWYKNENHISWLNGEPFVTSPDCIGVVDLETGEALTNSAIAPDQSVAVIGVKALDLAYRTDKGLEILSPRHFGFDMDYVPIEDRVREIQGGGD
jgi:DUF917 family protein